MLKSKSTIPSGNLENFSYKAIYKAIAVAGLCASIPFNALAADESANTDSSNHEHHLESIIVTGEKINKDIKSTTNAVTVIGEESFENGEMTDVNELVKLIPNVTTGGYGTINIRGVNGSGPSIGSNAFMTNGNPRVSTNVDGVSEAWGGYNFNPAYLWDVSRVEVLRGPQSTSQGANSIGGAMVLKTNEPTQEWEAAIRGGVESYDNGNTSFNQAVMLSGPLVEDQLAFRIAVDRSDGDTWITYAEDDDELTDAPDLDEVKSLTARGKLLWTPTSVPQLTAKLTMVHRKNEGTYLNWVDNDSNDTLTLSEDDRTNTRVQDSDVNTFALDVDYRFNSTVTNQMQISYNDYLASFEEYPGTTLLDIDEQRTTFEDRLILTPENSGLTGFVGVYISDSDSTLDVNFGTETDAYDGNTDKLTMALFGETSYEFNQNWALTVGARVQHEMQDRYLDAWDNILDEELSENVFLPKVEVIYSFDKDHALGASIRKGYNPGGNALDWSDKEYYTFDSETVVTYEISSKNTFANTTMLNANIFYNDYSQYQAYTDYRLENVDEAYTYGAELELQAYATDYLELRGSIGTLQSQVTSTDEDDWRDNELPFAADFNLSAGFTQYINDNWSFGADATYVSEYYSDLENTEDELAGDYFSVDARMKYVIGDLDIDAYITNLTNEEIVYQVRNSQYAAGQSRTIGLNLTYRM